jgi:hypothetical protein
MKRAAAAHADCAASISSTIVRIGDSAQTTLVNESSETA